jgi:hypothetical protein
LRIIVAVILGTAVLGLASWAFLELLFGGPVICVVNLSPTDLQSVRLLGNGFEEELPAISAESSACVRPSLAGAESSLEFQAIADGQSVAAADLIYLESSGGYRVKVQVSPELRVSASYGPVSLALGGWL